MVIFCVTGFTIVHGISLVNVIVVDIVPLEFMYLDNIGYLLGGSIVYYLGCYGFAAELATPQNRY